MAKIAEVNATPNTGWDFISWTEDGNIVSTSAAYTFEVSKDVHLVANFEKKTFLISVGLLGSGSVSGAGSYQFGDEVVLGAIPDQGHIFEGWYIDGTLISSNSELTFTAEADVSIEARFSEIKYTITVEANPPEGGSVSGGGIY